MFEQESKDSGKTAVRPVLTDLVARLDYVFQQAEELGATVTLVEHARPSSTCYQKCDQLRKQFPDEGWTDERVVKAIYAIIGSDEPHVFVHPEVRPRPGKSNGRKQQNGWGSIDEHVVRKALRALQHPLPSDCRPYIGQDCIPSSMEQGTCTPFISPAEMQHLNDCYGTPVKGIFVHEMPALEDQIVNISVGGQGEWAHRRSLHLPYGAIYGILAAQFPGQVQKLDFWK